MSSEPPPTALILAGGFGTRLEAEVPNLPKPMAPVAGRPFAEWLVDLLREAGVPRVVFCTGYRGEAIESFFGTGARFGVEIAYSHESEPLGTGGALRLAAESESGERLLAVNGDSWCEFDLDRLERLHRERRARATLWTVTVADGARYGSVNVRPDGSVGGFSEKSERGPARINAGVYLFERSALLAIPGGRPVSLEREVLPSLADCGLFAVAGDGPLLDIGTPESYRGAERFFAEARRSRSAQSEATVSPTIRGEVPMSRRRFVVLDRDGTLVVERHYLSDPAEVELTEGAAEGLRRFRGLGLGLVVVTNQSAVGRGLFDGARLASIHARLEAILAAEGIALDAIYVCPHVPEDDCACRKPRTGLLERAGRELAFDPAESFVIGDKASDIELGRRAGAETILVRTGYGAAVEASAPSGDAMADHVVANLAEAAAVIARRMEETGAGPVHAGARGGRTA